MNKKLDIRKNTIILFVINIIVLISLIFFRAYYTSKLYSTVLVNVVFGVNIVLLLAGVIFNLLILKNPDKYDRPLLSKIIITVFVIYLLFNTVFMVFINKNLSSGYTKVNQELSSYCDTFGCDRYETIAGNGYEEFVIKKIYFDYNNDENDLEIVTKYNTKEVISVTATIYSNKDMFSETIIYDELKNYFSNFGYDIKESKIKEAFDNRITSSVSDDNATYKVTEVYKNEELQKLKTIITLDLKQE